MIAVPFVFFLLLTFVLYYKKRCFDTSCVVSTLFCATSFFSILMDFFSLRSGKTFSYDFSYTAPFFFCFYIALGILPLVLFSGPKNSCIRPVNNPFFLKVLAVLCFLYFALNTVLSLDDIMNVLLGDMKALRDALYRGEYESGWISRIPGTIRLPFIFFNMALSVSWIYIFFAFYCICIQKMPLKYFIFFLLASLNEPIVGIVGVDRSKMTYWIISFLAIYIFFKNHLSPKQNKAIVSIGFILSFFAIIYLSVMTDSRFGAHYYGGVGGSLGGTIVYLGQPYINFCYFFDNIVLSETTSAIYLPFTNTFLFHNPLVGVVNVQQYFSNLTGEHLGVFYTYLGQILVSAGHYVLFAFVCVFFWLSMCLLKRKNLNEFSLWDSFVYLACASVLFLGIFVHYYSSSGKTFALVFFAVVSLCLTKNVKLK